MNPSRPSLDPDRNDPLARQLERLPNLAAPNTLIPRVMAAVQARHCLPWYRLPWSGWPRSFQCLALAVLSLLLGTLTYACLHFPELAGPGEVGARINAWLAPWLAVWNAGKALAAGVVTLCDHSGGWACALLAGLVLAAYLSTLGAGTVLYRLAFNKPSLRKP